MKNDRKETLDHKLEHPNYIRSVGTRQHSLLKHPPVSMDSKVTGQSREAILLPREKTGEKLEVDINNVMNPKRKIPDRYSAQAIVTNLNYEHLTRLTIFLVPLICAQLLRVDCQKHHYFYPDEQFLSNNEHLILSQRQALDQLLRAQNQNNQFLSSWPRAQKLADRRTSTGGSGPQTSGQQSNGENSKLLVCYYTTRQSASQWPKDAREFVVPHEGLNSISGELSSQTGFMPILQYDPNTSPVVDYSGDSSAGQSKNQQQQLVFKSAQLVGGHSFSGTQKSNNGNKSKHQEPSVASSPSLTQQNQQQQPNLQVLQMSASHQLARPTVSFGHGKSKQTPAYSFIGDVENNNGLIVSVNRGSATTPPGALPATILNPITSGQNGNNGNNLIITNDNNNGPPLANQLERESANSAQVLFSPPLNRAFIVNSQAGVSNNELLDTKSQLYIPAVTSQHNAHYHQLASASSPSPSLYQQHEQVAGKSLQLPGGEQLSPSSHHLNVVGPVSSESPPVVPLSSASSALLVQSGSYRSSQAQFAPPNTNLQQQLIVGQPQKSPILGGVSNLSSNSKLHLSAPTSTDAGKSSFLPSSSSLGSPTSTNGHPLAASASPHTSSTPVSSPLSSMFDVFGAASQYLMRFKPSSLISPSTFTFSAVSSNDFRQNHAIKGGNSSLGSPSSLIPLPFSSNLLANIQKNPLTGERSSAVGGSGGFLSRLSGQNIQRRDDVCGRTIQTPQRRIIGGEGARYGEFPYQVHIKIAKHQCGGALVDKQSIVTAAHCVYHFITRAPVSKLQIVIGAYDIEDEQYQELPPQYFKVNKVKLHPNFRFSASHPDRYDIAILKLDKPVKYTDNVLPVCLPSKDLKFESMVGTVTGFGKTDPSLSNRYGTRLLQKVDVPIIENNECERWHRTRGIDLKIFPEMMCAGYEDGLKDACVGDSGGPLVVKTAAGPNGSFRWTLAGITSAGFGCAQSRQPGIYHRVSHTVDWIIENLD